MREIHWAVLGTGVIANEMATALENNGKKLYAVGNRTYEKAVKFGEKYGIKKVYTDFNEMFTDPEVDVIYITTPHNTHIQFMKKAIENGKHILVEKSITLNSKELDEALELAKEKGIANGEKVRISSARGTVDAVAMVTVRLTPFKCGGKTVHQVGMTFNYGWLQPKECGDTANLLSPMVGDANSMTPEYKAFMVNIDKIKA